MDLTFYCGERENKTIYSKQHSQNRVTSTAEEKKYSMEQDFGVLGASHSEIEWVGKASLRRRQLGSLGRRRDNQEYMYGKIFEAKGTVNGNALRQDDA